jgi:SPX domain protein involved in polyphosphate accumulation
MKLIDTINCMEDLLASKIIGCENHIAWIRENENLEEYGKDIENLKRAKDKYRLHQNNVKRLKNIVLTHIKYLGYE